jgi:iron complex outermembrane receptor protein
VLVDGRRWIRGSFASGVSGAVDINTIPNNAVKSIEISMDGASTVYGSVAIAGVVNIITQDDYNGFKASAYYGAFEEGDGDSVEVDLAFGAEGERSRMFIDVSWTDQKEVMAGDREISEYAIQGFPWGLSSGTPEGRLVFTDPRTGQTLSLTSYTPNPVYDPACWATGTSVVGCDDFQPFTLADRFNWQPFNFLLTPNERVSMFAKAEYDITETTMFRLTASFNKRQSVSQAAPEPLFFGPEAGAGTILDNLFWPADHPYNPFGIDMGPDNFVFTGRRPIEAGPRIFEQDVETWYVSAGLDGQFDAGGNTIYWDATAFFSENDAAQVKHGAFNAQNIALALGPSDACDATPGCVPLNWVGPGTMSQEMLDFVTFVQKDVSNQELFDFTFKLTGEFGGLSAGSIGWAAGFEHREEDGTFTPDSIVSRGFTAGVPASPTAGGFEVDVVYAEFIMPPMSGDNGERLDISASGRYSKYDLFDSDTVFAFGSNWAPTADFVIRANYAEGYRAPNIGELFNTGSRFDASIVDPCSNAQPAVQANCASLGVPPDAQDVLTKCVETLDPFFCDNVSHAPGGTVQRVDGVLLNIGGIETSGIDWKVELTTAGGDMGQFRIQWLSTYLLDYTEIVPGPDGDVNISREGTELGSPERAFVEYKSTLNTDWFYNNWSARLSFQYYGSIEEQCAGMTAAFELWDEFCTRGQAGNDIDSTIFTNLQASWSPDLGNQGDWTFQVGVDNVLEETTPFCASCDLNSFDGMIYPIPGRSWYARAVFRTD